MMKIYRRLPIPVMLSLITIGTILQVALAPTTAHAACGKVETALIQCNTGGSNNGIWAVLLIVVNLLTAGIGIVAVGGIVYAAILYTSAGDNEGQTSKAKGLITNVVIGIVGFGLLYSFLQYIIPGGFMNTLTSPPTVADAPKDPEPPKNVNGAGSNPSDTTLPSGAGACYTIGATSASQGPHSKMYHRHGGVPYAFENSPQGIRYAANHGFISIDLDIWVTKDGVPVATHTGRPLIASHLFGGFHDTAGKITNAGRRINTMTYEQVRRLKHVDGYEIYSLQHLIGVLQANNMNLSLEIKAPNAVKKKLPEIANWLNEAHVKATVKGALNISGMNDALTYARQIGFWTRGTKGSQGWKPAHVKKSICKQFKS